MMKRTLSLLLAVLCAAPLLTACGSGEDSPAVTAASADTAEVTEAVTTAEPTNEELLASVRSGLPDEDYDGYEFMIYDRDEANHVKWHTVDVLAESINGDPVNDAVYERNSILEEQFNIKIAEHRTTAITESSKLILAGDDAFDVVTDGLSALASSLATPGYVMDVNAIDEIDLSRDWWDHRIIEGLSIANQVYFITGDISIMDNYGTWCFMFNKSILNDFNLDSPYDMIADNCWTLENVKTMSEQAALDLDGDGKMGDWDQYGFLSESFNTYGLWLGSGEMITRKDADDLPYLCAYNDRAVAVLDLVMELQLNTESTITGDRHSKSMADGVNVLFKQGGGLFIFGGMWLISDYRDSEVDFGIAPSPKYEESQDGYYNTYSYGNCTAYSIPITASDLSRTGTILEAMAAVSKYTLTPAYYEVALQGKFLRDEESKDMIDLVLANRSFDLCAIFDWGGAFSMFGSMYTAKTNDFASRYATLEEKTNTAIEKFVEQITG